jgi:hypothetical protein
VLLARCEAQRRELGVVAADVAGSLWVADAAVLLTRRAASHPLVVTGAVVAAVVVFRPRSILRFLAWGVSGVLTMRRVSRAVREIVSVPGAQSDRA